MDKTLLLYKAFKTTINLEKLSTVNQNHLQLLWSMNMKRVVFKN